MTSQFSLVELSRTYAYSIAGHELWDNKEGVLYWRLDCGRITNWNILPMYQANLLVVSQLRNMSRPRLPKKNQVGHYQQLTKLGKCSTRADAGTLFPKHN